MKPPLISAKLLRQCLEFSISAPAASFSASRACLLARNVWMVNCISRRRMVGIVDVVGREIVGRW